MDLLTFILFIIGFGLLISGAEFLVRGSSRLAIAIGISPLVVGLTVVAFGTSAPELAVTILSTYAGEADIGIGNVVGSNIANILLVLGISATVGSLLVAKQLIKIEIPLMIFISFLVWIMGFDGEISRVDGLILFAGAVTYTVLIMRRSRKEVKASNAASTVEVEVEPIPPFSLGQIFVQLGLIALGLTMLVIGSNWLIDGAVAVAELLGVSRLVIGLTIVAVGTSLPEVATSVIATIRNNRDIAVGNAVGSNIFNILLVLGLGSAVSPAGINVPVSAIFLDIPVMIAVAIVCLPIFYTNYRIDRLEGIIMLLYYAGYTTFLYLSATQSPALSTFTTVAVTFVLPLTGIVLLIGLIRFHFQSRTEPSLMHGNTAPPRQS